MGTEIINAYLLENKAVYPRVIIDRELMQFEGMKAVLLRERNLSWLYTSEYKDSLSGYIYIDYLKVLAKYDHLHYNDRLNSVVELIVENIYSNVHFEKYKWILKNWIDRLEHHISVFEPNIPVLSNLQMARKKVRINKEILVKLKNYNCR